MSATEKPRAEPEIIPPGDLDGRPVQDRYHFDVHSPPLAETTDAVRDERRSWLTVCRFGLELLVSFRCRLSRSR